MKKTFFDMILLSGLALLPKNMISRCMGRLVEIQWPAPINRFLIRLFARLAGVNLSDVRDPIASFKSIQSFFVRELKPGVRSFDIDPQDLGSPCDGAWGTSGVVKDGQLLQIKGRPYSLDTLLGNEVPIEHLEGASFATLYLSPKDYHRFHAPLSMQVLRTWYLPGYLWPVNGSGVRGIDSLFAVNERIVIEVALPHTQEPVMWIVAVGATMVGKVLLGFSDLTTNKGRPEKQLCAFQENPILLKKGDYLGHFCFGSTLVLVMDPKIGLLAPQAYGSGLKLGENIGKLI